MAKIRTEKYNLQLYPSQWRALRHRAIEAGKTASHLAREAIDEYLAKPERKATHQGLTTPSGR